MKKHNNKSSIKSSTKHGSVHYTGHRVITAGIAGRNAFKIGSDPQFNPYKTPAEKAAWNKGFFDEMNARELVRPAHGAKPQLRLRYAAQYRIPYGDRLPEKPFVKRLWRYTHAEEATSFEPRSRRDRG